MLLIRKLEKKDGNFAPKLKESIEMKEMWKEARIRKMRDEQWVKDFERERVRMDQRVIRTFGVLGQSQRKTRGMEEEGSDSKLQ